MTEIDTFRAKAAPRDQWEYDRQQNIIDTVDDAPVINGLADTDPASYETAKIIRAQAVAVQNYLIQNTLKSEEVIEIVEASDDQWRADNPPPPIEPDDDGDEVIHH